MEPQRKKGENIAVRGEEVTIYLGRQKKPTLDKVNINVARGHIYGLLGPSGCGKTTLLKIIVGRLTPKSGLLKVFGRTPGESSFFIPGRGVGYMPQDLALYPEITTEETLKYFGRLYHMPYAQIVERTAFLVTLIDIPNKKTLIRNLSGGQQRRVSFAAALINKPPLLVLDEPTVGVDPILRQNIWKYMKDLVKDDYITVIITTHYVEEARQANMVGLMRDGRLLIEMSPKSLLQKYNAVTLEDVFLKLCRKEEDQDHIPVEHTVLLNDKIEELSEVWTIREEPNGNALNNLESDTNDSLLPPDVVITSPDLTVPQRMNHSRIRMCTLISKSFLRLKRNIPLAFFEIFVPVIQVVVFCLCIGGDPFDLPIAVVNMERDPTKFAQMYLNTLDNKTFQQRHFTNMSLAVESTKVGDTWGVIFIGPQFTECLMDRFIDGIHATNETIVGSEVQLYLDATNQQITMTIYSSLVNSFLEFSRKMLHEVQYNPLLAEPPIVMKTPIYGETEPNFTEFMAPGMVLGITYIMAVGLTAMSIIIERKEGLLDRSMVAGVTAGEVIFSILFHLFLMMFLQVVIVLLITFLVFNIPVLGCPVSAMVCVLLVGLCGMAYGLFVSAICGDENAAMMVSMGSFYPILLLSGIIWPVEAMPFYLRHLSYALPMTLLCRTLRCILSKGWNMSEHGIWDGPLIISTWIILLVLGAWLIFKYRKHT